MSELQRQVQLAKYYRHLKFLVIDDFENFRMSIRQMIRSFGVEKIEVAGTGEDAVRRCENQHFDVVICDYNLGSGKNGQQVLEELGGAQQDYFEKFGFIFLICASGRGSKEILEAVKQRLPHSAAEEMQIVAEEQAKIIHLRLEKLLN